jgi:hypothetical protein
MNIHIPDSSLLDQHLVTAFRKMAELVALTDWRINAYPQSGAATSSVLLPWCRLPRPAYWRAKTNSGRVYQVARQVAQLKSLAVLSLPDADVRAIRDATQVVVAEIDGFLNERDAGRPARYRTDLSDFDVVAAKLDGVQLDRHRDTIDGRYSRAMAAIEDRFGKYCEPPDVETRQIPKKSGYTGVIKIETPAWVRELWAKFPQHRRSAVERKIPKDKLRAEAERLVADYLERGGNFPGYDPIVLLPPGRAWGYDGCGGWERRSYHPLSKRSGYIVEKRPPAASGAGESFPVLYFSEAAWLRGNHPWPRGPETAIMAKRPCQTPCCGPVITGTSTPRAYCSNKAGAPTKQKDTAEDALRNGFIIGKPTQGEDPDEDLNTERFSRASREPADDDNKTSDLQPVLGDDELKASALLF